MRITSQQDFLASLFCEHTRNELAVFVHSRHYLLRAVDEIGFDDFRGADCTVLGRMSEALGRRSSEAALWGRVFIDLWFCSNFGGRHWDALVARDAGNVRYAIEAAFWVFAVSGADGGAALAAILNRHHCWDAATDYVPEWTVDAFVEWWRTCVLPHRQ